MASRAWIGPLAGSMLLAQAIVAGAAGQAPPPATQKPIVKTVSAVPIASLDGKDNFAAYCAVCHGGDARGNGPAAPAMKAPVPDLTTYATRHGGKFNLVAVEMAIRQPGAIPTPSHGAEAMPIWGEVFRAEDRARNLLRIQNLARYLESIQVPPKSSSR